MEEAEKRYYTVEEVAEYLTRLGVHCSPRTVRLWIKVKKLKAFRPGGRAWYITKDALEEFLRREEEGRLALQGAAA